MSRLRDQTSSDVIIAVDPGAVRTAIVVVAPDRRILSAEVVARRDGETSAEYVERAAAAVDETSSEYTIARAVIEWSPGHVIPGRGHTVHLRDLGRIEGAALATLAWAGRRTATMERRRALDLLRIPCGGGRGETDRAVRALVEAAYPGCRDGRRLCYRRRRRAHGPDCPDCGGTGETRAAGPLRGLGQDACDAVALAMAYRLELGL